MNHSPANGEAFPAEPETEAIASQDESLTYGQRIIQNLNMLSSQLNSASDEEILSLAQSFAALNSGQQEALFYVSEFISPAGIKGDIGRMLNFVENKSAKSCDCWHPYW